MSLSGGDLTTPDRVATWMANAPVLPSAIISQLIGSMSRLICGKLNRTRLYSQTYTRIFDGVGTMQIVLPDFPVTSIEALYVSGSSVPRSIIPAPGEAQPTNTNRSYGYRFSPWDGNLPGENAVVEFAGGFFYTGVQNIKITYTAGYKVIDEEQTVPGVDDPTTQFPAIIIDQSQGIWCRDEGVTYGNGTALEPVQVILAAGQYIPPDESLNPGTYTFSPDDSGNLVLISYSFVPADLEEACIQMIVERYNYRTRVGEIAKTLGGQETMRWARGSVGPPWNRFSSLPPEVMDLISPYISVVPPVIGAPV